THCGESKDNTVTARFGRLPNERSPYREAFAYRLLETVGVPTLRARPARITYAFASSPPHEGGAQKTIDRNALLLENEKDAFKRLGGDRELPVEQFTNAREQFSTADSANLAFGEALVGNFDWCV